MSNGELTIPTPPSHATRPRAASAADRAKPDSRSGIGRLVLDRITKRFPKSDIVTLQDITIGCEAGEFVVVVGPSGCGKTTLLNIAAGMATPDSGTAVLDGRAINGPGPDRAMVFQNHGLFPWLTASQNVEFGLKMAGVAASERADRVENAMRMVNLTTSRQKLVHEMSGGQQQRVAIARAMVMNPAVLLMDEPFAAVDAQTRTNLHEQLQNLWCQTHKTILFVTHSVGEAVRLADRIIILAAHPGRIRKEIRVELPHPRKFDSADINELARLVRREIGEEVNRVNALAGEDSWRSQTSADLGDFADDLGGSI